MKELKSVLHEIETSVVTIADLNIEPLYKYIEDYENKELKYKTTKHSCYMPWHNCYITWEGDVVPCCYFYDKQVCFGNVFKESFKSIWNNSKYQSFRRTMAKGRSSKICQTCRNDEEFLENKLKKIRKIPLIKSMSRRR